MWETWTYLPSLITDTFECDISDLDFPLKEEKYNEFLKNSNTCFL